MSVTCPVCGQEYLAGGKFCSECGARLSRVCPACGTLAASGRFCSECGTSLTGPPASHSSSVSQPSDRDPQGERKQLTVLFADVQRSMDLQEEIDVEAWAKIVNRFVNIITDAVHRFGGTVDKFTGDGIMALFGAPVAQEDHGRRACHAALHLIKAVASYAEELCRSEGVDLQVRVGLNSGEVVVGTVGDDLHVDPTALGHAVGLAQRMESLAEPGCAYLTEDTARLAEGWFQLKDLGPMMVKGAREPARVYLLEGPAPTVSRVDRFPGISRLVGRAKELAVLEDAMAEAAEGRAQVLGVVGEAGVGKSRLCEEFARAVTARGITVRRTGGVSYGREVPLLPILALLRDSFGITEADTPGEARDKLAGRLLALDPTFAEDLPLLFDLLEVPDPQRPGPKLAPEVRMRRILEVLRRVTQRRSEREMLVVLFEDLHLFDPQSEDFLERLVESYPGTRTLALATFRPEFSAAWMRHSYYRQLPLGPLRGEALAELLGGLLGVDLSLAPFLGVVAESTGGNPFFVEEVVRALIADGTLARDAGVYRLTRPLDQVRVPPTVHAVLAARIDGLSADHKSLLETAAVIGRSFPEPVLARVSGRPAEELESALRTLCAAEFLQEVEVHPVAEYRFWHPLTQEVAYGTLLSERRAHLHAAVAEALQDHEVGRLDERAAVLAWHWERAGRPLEAARWTMRAARFALRTDLAEALRRWRSVLALLEGQEEDPRSLALAVQAQIRLIQFGARTGMDPESADRLENEARAMSERLGDPGQRGMIFVVTGAARLLAGDLHGALDHYLEAAGLGHEADDPAVRAALWMPIPLPLTYVGPLADGLNWSNQSISACAAEPERGAALMGFSPLARAFQYRGGLLSLMGRLDEAAAAFEQALALARPRAEPETVSWTLALLPQLAWMTGEDNDTSAFGAEAVHLAEETGNVVCLVLALEGSAVAHLAAGRPDEAIVACERALAEARGHRSGLFEEASVLAHLARSRLAANNPADAAVAADEAVTVARRQEARVVECLALLTRAKVLSATGGPAVGDAVLADLDAALRLTVETGAATYEPFIREELGRLRGDPNELREAQRLYTQIGATGHARRLKEEIEVSSQPAATVTE